MNDDFKSLNDNPIEAIYADESFEADITITLEKKEIVAGLESIFRKSGRTFNVVKTVILVVAFVLFVGSSIYEKTFFSINSFIAAVILIIILMIWLLPTIRFGKIADEMILAEKNKLHLRIKGDLFIFGDGNTVSINFLEQPPKIYLKNLVFNKDGNVFIVPSRVLSEELWTKFTSF